MLKGGKIDFCQSGSLRLWSLLLSVLPLNNPFGISPKALIMVMRYHIDLTSESTTVD